MLKLLLVIALFALATYLLVRVIQRRGLLGPTQGRTQRPPRRMVAPDDDEDFLRDLDRKRKRKRKHPEDPEDPDTT